MGVVAIVIIAMAVYVFTHFSTIEFNQALILGGIGIAALLIVMGMLLVLMRVISRKKEGP
jgi:hypothetical protein